MDKRRTFASDASAHAGSVQLVVIEDGTNGFEEAALPSGVDGRVVIAQSGGERPTELASRVIRRIEALEGAHQAIAGTVLLLSPRFDAEATAARVSISRMLMAHAAAAFSPSDLLLSAGAELHPDLQAKVLALAEVLTGDAAASVLAISVQFAADGIPSSRHLAPQSVGERGSAFSR